MPAPELYCQKSNRNRLQALRNVVKIQGHKGNWDYNEYMRGMYNGLELALAIMENREPIYKGV